MNDGEQADCNQYDLLRLAHGEIAVEFGADRRRKRHAALEHTAWTAFHQLGIETHRVDDMHAGFGHIGVVVLAAIARVCGAVNLDVAVRPVQDYLLGEGSDADNRRRRDRRRGIRGVTLKKNVISTA